MPMGRIRDVAVRLSLGDSTFTVSDFTAAIEDGLLNGTFTLDVAAAVPQLSLRLNGKALPLDMLLGDDGGRVLHGGHLGVALDLNGAGPTTRAFAASADGRIRLDLRDARIAHAGAAYASGDLLVTLVEVLSASADGDDASRLECAVADFPLEGGRLESQTGIGFMTDTLSVRGGGYVDLGDETLSLFFDPKPREGIGLSAAGFADFVRLEGKLGDPRPVTDARGLASLGLRTGAAVASGGLTLLAEALFDRAAGENDACESAMNATDGDKPAMVESRTIPPPPAAEVTTASGPERAGVVEETVRTIETGLDSLFGF